MLIFPRVLGVLVLVWGVRALAEGLLTGEAIWLGMAALWLLATGYLMALRLVPLASLLVLALVGLELVLRVPPLSGLQLLTWLAIIVAITNDQPQHRALLLRTCASTVYAFAALSKLNPSWLAGEGITGLISGQPQLSALRFVGESPVLATVVAVGVICMEGGVAIALWRPKLRGITAGIGVVMHLAFIVGAASNIWAATHLTLFNFGLVACYPAFWADIGTRYRAAAIPKPGHAPR